MTYVVSYGAMGQCEESFTSFTKALRCYRLKRAYMLTLPKRHWFVVNMHNPELLDEQDSGLTDEEAFRVYDDTVPRSLLNDRPGAYHGLVCGHAVAECTVREEGLNRYRCAICQHTWSEVPL